MATSSVASSEARDVLHRQSMCFAFKRSSISGVAKEFQHDKRFLSPMFNPSCNMVEWMADKSTADKKRSGVQQH